MHTQMWTQARIFLSAENKCIIWAIFWLILTPNNNTSKPGVLFFTWKLNLTCGTRQTVATLFTKCLFAGCWRLILSRCDPWAVHGVTVALRWCPAPLPPPTCHTWRKTPGSYGAVSSTSGRSGAARRTNFWRWGRLGREVRHKRKQSVFVFFITACRKLFMTFTKDRSISALHQYSSLSFVSTLFVNSLSQKELRGRKDGCERRQQKLKKGGKDKTSKKKRCKYKELNHRLAPQTQIWTDPRVSVLQELIRKGIPHHFRAIVWQLLGNATDMPVKNQYSELLKMSSPCEKLIRRDIARTYPEHEFFKGQDSLGQEVLFNVMKVSAAKPHNNRLDG